MVSLCSNTCKSFKTFARRTALDLSFVCIIVDEKGEDITVGLLRMNVVLPDLPINMLNQFNGT